MPLTTRPANQASEDPMDEIRRILFEGLRGTGARVVLFGSRATGTFHRASDVDVAVLPRTALPVGLLGKIREALEESTVPFSVDLVDLSDAAPALWERVQREGVSWTD